MTNHALVRRGVACGLAVSGASLVVVATFLTWFDVAWFRGAPMTFHTSFNLYQLSSLSTSHWNSLAPAFILAGAAILALSGVTAVASSRLGNFTRWSLLAMLIGVVLVSASSLLVQVPKLYGAFGINASHGPGLWIALVGAGRGRAGFIALATIPGTEGTIETDQAARAEHASVA